MRKSALTVFAASLAIASLSAQSKQLERALERIEKNDVNGLRRLLQEDPSLVRRTEAGVVPHWQWTLLHAATAGAASVDIVGALIDAGAEVNARDNEGNTPLHFAMKRINREKVPARDYEGIIRLLLEKKADVHALNIGGASPLHTATAFRADPAAVELLIKAGAEINRKTPPSYDAWTPLHGAAARNSAGIVAVLLKYGADVSATDGRGATALQVAERSGFAETAGVLRSAAAAAAPATGAPATAAPPATTAPSTAATPPATTTGGVAQGRVLWNGQPVAGATVFVADSVRAPVRYGTAVTDEQGRFTISGIPEGNRFVGVEPDPQVYMGNGASFTATAAKPFARDFALCKLFETVAPADNETVSGRPVLRWDPYPGAARYVVNVVSQSKPVFRQGGPTGDLTATSVQVDVDLPAGAYRWQAYAYAPGGQVIACSSARTFTVRP